MLLGKGVGSSKALAHPPPAWLPSSNSEPKNSAVGTGLDKNSLGRHIPAPLATGHRGHMGKA